MTQKKGQSRNIRTVLAVLNDEIRGDVQAALQKLDKDYSMTWVYSHPKTGKLFPSTARDVKTELKEIYPIKGRRYDIKHIAEGTGVIFVELVESYPDPKTKKIYRTPLVLVLEMKNGKIRRGWHYCDPNLSYLHLTKHQIARAFKYSQ